MWCFHRSIFSGGFATLINLIQEVNGVIIWVELNPTMEIESRELYTLFVGLHIQRLGQIGSFCSCSAESTILELEASKLELKLVPKHSNCAAKELEFGSIAWRG